MSSRFEIEISDEHLDEYQHVNNAEYFRILEAARWKFLESNGRKKSEIVASGLVPVLLRIEIDFKKELFRVDRIEIETKVKAGGSRIFYILQTLRKGEEISADAKFVHGFFNLKTRKIEPIPEEWRSLIFS